MFFPTCHTGNPSVPRAKARNKWPFAWLLFSFNTFLQDNLILSLASQRSFSFEKTLINCERNTKHNKPIQCRQVTWSPTPAWRVPGHLRTCTQHFWWLPPSGHLLPWFHNFVEEDRQLNLACSRAIVWIFTILPNSLKQKRCNWLPTRSPVFNVELNNR